MKHILIVFFCIGFLTCAAQEENKNKYPLVHVTNWVEKSYEVREGFWESTKNEIISKIGEEAFNKIKKWSHNKMMPQALLIWDGDRRVSLEEYVKRLSSLKVYQVVDATQVTEGTNFGKYTILAVPNQELYWDKTAKWDTVYFVIKSSVVELVKN
jgi:hypothetical protein